MLIVLNDIAFGFKFQNKYVAIEKVKELIELIINLRKFNPTFRISACQRLGNVELADGYFLSQLFSEPQEVFERKYQTALKTFFLNPNIIASGEGVIKYKEQESRQLAATYEATGFLLSLVSEEDFLKEVVECDYCGNHLDEWTQVEIKNISIEEHISIYRHMLPIRKYEFNPKHKVNGGWGSEMDLSDDEAQEALNNAVEANSDTKHLIVKYKGNYYSFRSHIDIYYHGYKDETMPQNLKSKLCDLE